MSEIYNGGYKIGGGYIAQFTLYNIMLRTNYSTYVGKRWVSGGGLKMAEGREVVNNNKKKIIRDSLTRFWRAANDFNEYRWVPDVPLNFFFFFYFFILVFKF